ncbi:hypothetical protein [Aeromonas sp. 601039]
MLERYLINLGIPNLAKLLGFKIDVQMEEGWSIWNFPATSRRQAAEA